VLTALPLDTSSKDEPIQAAFISGDLQRSVRLAAEMDIWLGAHIADILLKLGHEIYPHQLSSDVDKPREAPPDDELVLSRDILIMDFAERLHSDPTCWAIELEYLQTCGTLGRGRMSEVIGRLAVDVESKLDMPDDPIAKLNSTQSGNDHDLLLDDRLDYEVDEESPKEKLGELTGLQRVEKLVDICREYEMWDELESLCRVRYHSLVYGICLIISSIGCFTSSCW
jgi:nuclear pore complex protein Nup85